MRTKRLTLLSGALAFVVIALLINGCRQQQAESTDSSSKSKLKGTISISGAFALYPMTVKWAEIFMELHPKVRIDISAGGAGKGMTYALSGMVDLGMFSRSVSQAEIDKGAWYIATVKDAVVPTININNPLIDKILTTGFTKDEFYRIYIPQEIQNWDKFAPEGQKGQKMNVYTRSDACGAAQMWGEYLGRDQESLNGIGVYGDPGMADAVKNDPLAIGFNNIGFVYDMNTRKKYEGMEILPIDLNENGQIDPEESVYDTQDDIMNAIKNDLYPSPPARDLFFVSKGKPQNEAVIEFLRWILTEGQKYVNESGYVELPQEKIEKELSKL
jgi:phosphate transport system substrate-binding protein